MSVPEYQGPERRANEKEQWRIAFVLDSTVERMTEMSKILSAVVERLNGEQGLGMRVQRLEDKADQMHADFTAFAQQQQRNHEQNRQDLKANRAFQRSIVIAAVPIIPTVLGGIWWLVARSFFILHVGHV